MKTEVAQIARTSDSVPEFIALIKQGVESFNAAAEMLARIVAKDETAIAKITEAAPEIPASFLSKLLKVGERSLHPSLLLNGCPAYQRLALLPFSAQETALRNKAVPVVIDAETGDSLRVPLVELTPAQVSQVIATDGVRSKDAQQSWLKRRQVATAVEVQTAKLNGPRYQVKRGEVVFFSGCTLSKIEMLRILEEMVA